MRRVQRPAFVAALVLIGVAGGCLESVTRCHDGRICTGGLVCDVSFAGCVDPAPCFAMADGAGCRAPGVLAGECRAGECVPTTCGDQVIDDSEACDDGELLSHDGCSSDCTLENPKWTLSPQLASPAPGYERRVAYDAERGRVVLLGADGKTWEWDGSEWTLSTGAAAPPRDYTALAYDHPRQRVLMFGGRVNSATDLADTWVRDGTDWIQLSPASSPSARSRHAMAYDAARRRIVLFGGFGGTDLGDTWEWDGVTWTQRTPALSPPARHFHAMAYDAARGRVVLFGGYRFDNMLSRTLGDTWEWDGITWRELTPAVMPPARWVHAMTYDANRRRVVLFGGLLASSDNLDDTWEWDGSSWTERTIPAPAQRERHVLAYSAIRRRIVLFGGMALLTQFQFIDTWEYRHESLAPDETCAAGIDGDGDGQFACDDPDCWGYCTPSCPPGVVCDPAAPRCGDGVCNPNLEPLACPADC